MTTFALIAGMIPVAIGAGEGADFRAPLGRAVIGGTITSTVLTLVVIPTVYEILDDMRSFLGRVARRIFRPGRGAPPPQGGHGAHAPVHAVPAENEGAARPHAVHEAREP
jgi:HAE1 family hydrophobic/amphiphilic exporter-1